MKNFILNILIGIIFLAGVSVLLYPVVSDVINRRNQAEVISSYEANVKDLDNYYIEELFKAAKEYNENLGAFVTEENASEIENSTEYKNMLNVTENGVMGYIDIDRIDVHLPIYHGTGETVLQVGAGHLATTSLPVGGESTHAVISAHTGLPSAKLFTNLDKLKLGDVFKLTILGKTLVYKIDDISVVLPEEVDNLRVVEGEDYVTLLTCTPYGINSHRLLVRGTRIPYEEAEKEGYLVVNEAIFIDRTVLVPFIVIPVAILYFVLISVISKKRKKEREPDGKN